MKSVLRGRRGCQPRLPFQKTRHARPTERPVSRRSREILSFDAAAKAGSFAALEITNRRHHELSHSLAATKHLDLSSAKKMILRMTTEQSRLAKREHELPLQRRRANRLDRELHVALLTATF
jgi:hypothetical protein